MKRKVHYDKIWSHFDYEKRLAALDLCSLREEIDKIDDEILKLFLKRLKVSEGVAEYKQRYSLPVINDKRESDVLDRLRTYCDDATWCYVKMLYNTVFDISRTHQRVVAGCACDLTDNVEKIFEFGTDELPASAVVACQGVRGAYSQIAADKFFKQAKINYTDTFEQVFEAVEARRCHYGVLPVENSIIGSVAQVYNLMKKYNFFIVRSLKLPVNHTLLGKTITDIKDVKEIYSHTQAIEQCSEFLNSHPEIKINICPNTAMAAKYVAQAGVTGVAAISSIECASLYGLNVLMTDIQNVKNNYTRFICISNKLQIFKMAHKASFMINLSHTPGALCSVLSNFFALGLNLIKLELCPKGNDFEFVFYFDVEGSLRDRKFLNLICRFQQDFDSFTFLGNYSEI